MQPSNLKLELLCTLLAHARFMDGHTHELKSIWAHSTHDGFRARTSSKSKHLGFERVICSDTQQPNKQTDMHQVPYQTFA